MSSHGCSEPLCYLKEQGDGITITQQQDINNIMQHEWVEDGDACTAWIISCIWAFVITF